MKHQIVLAVFITAFTAFVEAQQPIQSTYALTEASLQAAMLAGESGHVFPASILAQRIVRKDFAVFGGAPLNEIFTLYERTPYQVFVLTPYARAAATAADAKRRFLERPPLSVEQLNSDGVVVSALSGTASALSAAAVQNIVLTRGDIVVRPSKSLGGAFYFRLEDFVLPATLVCIGPRSNYEIIITADDLVPLDAPITDEALKFRLASDSTIKGDLDTFNAESRARQAAIIETQGFFVKDHEVAAIEANDIWIRFSWRAVIRNSLDHSKDFDLEIQFLNDRELIVDTDVRYRQSIPAFDERTFSGSALVSMPVAATVTHAKFVTKPR